MKKYIFTSLFLFLAMFSFAQERVLFEGTNISITPPEGFKKVDFFKGFFNYANGASIQLEPIDSIAYTLIAEGFTKEVLEPQGITFISKEHVTTNAGKKGILITMGFEVTQKNDQTGIDETRIYERLTFLTGDMNRTIYISANYAMLVKELVGELIKQSLYSAQFED